MKPDYNFYPFTGGNIEKRFAYKNRCVIIPKQQEFPEELINLSHWFMWLCCIRKEGNTS